jgi:L-rhamnose mutarotase
MFEHKSVDGRRCHLYRDERFQSPLGGAVEGGRMPRYCFLLRVRPDRLDEYRARHAAVWPEMLTALRDTGWRNYSLHLAPDGLLVGYVESDDLDAARAAMAATEVDPRWQAEMAPFFVADGAPQIGAAGMQVLDEVFHLEDQLTALEDRT